MSPVDIILIVVLALGAYIGYRKGLLMEIISMMAFLIGIIAGIKFLGLGMAFLSKYMGDLGPVMPFITFMVLFVLVVLAVNLLGKVLKKVIDLTFFGTFDNIIGAAIGIFKFALGASIILWVADKLNLEIPSQWTEGAVLLPYIKGMAPAIGNWLMALFPSFKDLLNPKGQENISV